MSLKTKTLSLVTLVILVVLALWWSNFIFLVPRFHSDANGNLVSGHTKLVLVSQMLPNDKVKVKVPKFIPFWKTIGIVEGENSGRLWSFTYNGKQYVAYQPHTEMPWQEVYTYK